MGNGLSIVSTAAGPPREARFSPLARRKEIQATMERLWHDDPLQFSPERDCAQKVRVRRTWEAIQSLKPLDGKRVVDIGCGSGLFSLKMAETGAHVDAVDAATLPLQTLSGHILDKITTLQDCLPYTQLPDRKYDAAICTEVIGYLNPQEYRLAISDLARVVKPEGRVVCSTPIMTNSDDALDRFAALAETEFDIDSWIFSYHLLWLKLCRFFEAPRRFVDTSRNSQERAKKIAESNNALLRSLYRGLTSSWCRPFWQLLSVVTTPCARYCRRSEGLLASLEAVTRFLWSKGGITHVIFVGRRRSLTFPLPASEIPVEMKHKRQVWE